MATIISVGIGRSGSRGVRPSINGLQFIECGVGRSGSRAPDAKILTGVGSGVIVVDSWDPENNSEDVDHHRSFTVNVHAESSITEFEKLYDGGGTFEAGGTLTDAVEVGEGVQLATESPLIGFEDYVTAEKIIGSSQPDKWTHLGNVYYGWTPVNSSEDWDGRHIHCYSGDNTDYHRLDDGGEIAAGIMSCDVLFDSDDSTCLFGLACNLTGSGSALRGHALVCGPGNGYMNMKRVNSAGNWYGIGSYPITTPSYDTLYKMKFKFTTDGSTTWFYFKWWPASGSEPASFLYLGNDTAYVAAGYCGIVIDSGVGGAHTHVDNFAIEPDPSTYVASGDWTSDEIDTTAIVHYSHALVEWDETTPADTTAAVKARWKTGGTWLACTNGGQVPGIDLGEDTTAGSSKDSLELKIELATTDASETPVVKNLRFYHEPLASPVLEIELGSVVACVAADGSLDIWGEQQVVGGTEVTAWDDVWLQTNQPYRLFGLGYSLLVKLIYNGVDIDEIIVDLARDFWAESSPLLGAQFSMDPLKYASAPVEARWVCQGEWAPMGHSYEWVLLDINLGIHVDAAFLVGHYQLDNHPGSFLAGARELANHPGSLLVKGFQLDSHPGSLLVQGWRHDNHIGSLLVGVQEFWNHPGSFLVAVERIDNHPGSFLVYGVNRDGAIMVNVIDDDTYDRLVAEGIVFS